MARLGWVAAVTLALTIGFTSMRAQQPPPQQPQQQQPPEPQGRGGRGGEPGGAAGQGRGEGRGQAPAKPLVPAAASSVAANPDRFIGEFVTMTGTVEQVLGKLAFSVDQDRTKSTGAEILVIPVRMNDPIEANTYVTVIGDVIKFDPEEVKKRGRTLPSELTPDLIAKYQGKPVVLANAVINAAMIDLAKFIPPPMTPEEAAFDKVMKGVGPANAALRKAMEASNAELIKTNTDILKKSFADTEAFWKTRGKADAMKFAAEARKATELIELAAAAGKWDDVKTHVNTLGQQCTACHGVYRERGEDGSFFIKPGSR